MLDQHRPVFVDPSGRRRRILRVVAALGATLTVGYLALIIAAAVGGPDSPAARLPVLPDRPVAAVPGPLPPAPAMPTGTAASNSRPAPATAGGAATSPTAPTAVTTSELRGRSPSKPSEPPSNGGRPTDPPGRG